MTALGFGLAATAAAAPIPEPLQSCFPCHSKIVRQYAGEHAMARSLGTVGSGPAPGKIESPAGVRYELQTDENGDSWLHGTFPDGGRRLQKIVGRIGAGVYDTSWATAEADVSTRKLTDRLFFAPVEHIVGRGLTLSPFEQGPRGLAMDKPLTPGCLRCHSDTPMEALPRAAASHGTVFPPNHLGADAFEHLDPLGCGACHGDTAEHLERMGRPGVHREANPELGLRRLASLDAGAQRDVCARCHLDADVHLDLTGGRLDPSKPLELQEPNLRIRPDDPDDFRFVGQVERLTESACFQGSPSMTCNTCHEAHRGVAAQGPESFNAACRSCHDTPAGDGCSRPSELAVATVSGEPARTRDGCIDCHVRRSQPFDLPHVRTSDHRIRRQIPLPRNDIPYRKKIGTDGPVERLTDGRLDAFVETPAGKKWLAGVRALAASRVGRPGEAAEFLRAYDRSTAETPAGLDTLPALLTLRAMTAAQSGADPAPLLKKILDHHPEEPITRLTLARRELELGRLESARRAIEAVLEDFPRADHAYFLLVKIAEKERRPDRARHALEAYVDLWPSDAVAWQKLARLRFADGDEAGARRALARVEALRPGDRPRR